MCADFEVNYFLLKTFCKKNEKIIIIKLDLQISINY